MKYYSADEIKKMSQRNAEVEIVNNVYSACLLFERLEDAGKIRGNGHHMAQEIAQKAEDLMKERWKDK